MTRWDDFELRVPVKAPRACRYREHAYHSKLNLRVGAWRLWNVRQFDVAGAGTPVLRMFPPVGAPSTKVVTLRLLSNVKVLISFDFRLDSVRLMIARPACARAQAHTNTRGGWGAPLISLVRAGAHSTASSAIAGRVSKRVGSVCSRC